MKLSTQLIASALSFAAAMTAPELGCRQAAAQVAKGARIAPVAEGLGANPQPTARFHIDPMPGTYAIDLMRPQRMNLSAGGAFRIDLLRIPSDSVPVKRYPSLLSRTAKTALAFVSVGSARVDGPQAEASSAPERVEKASLRDRSIAVARTLAGIAISPAMGNKVAERLERLYTNLSSFRISPQEPAWALAGAAAYGSASFRARGATENRWALRRSGAEQYGAADRPPTLLDQIKQIPGIRGADLPGFRQLTLLVENSADLPGIKTAVGSKFPGLSGIFDKITYARYSDLQVLEVVDLKVAALNAAVKEALKQYNGEAVSADVEFKTAETNAQRAVGVSVTAKYHRSAESRPQDDFDLKIAELSYSYPEAAGSKPETRARLSGRFNLLNVFSVTEINELGARADRMIAEFLEKYRRLLGDAARLEAKITRKDTDAEGNLTALGFLLDGDVDLAKLPATVHREDVPILGGRLEVLITLQALDVLLNMTSNPEAKEFQKEQTGLKEYLDKLLARDPDLVDGIARVVSFIDRFAQRAVAPPGSVGTPDSQN